MNPIITIVDKYKTYRLTEADKERLKNVKLARQAAALYKTAPADFSVTTPPPVPPTTQESEAGD